MRGHMRMPIHAVMHYMMKLHCNSQAQVTHEMQTEMHTYAMLSPHLLTDMSQPNVLFDFIPRTRQSHNIFCTVVYLLLASRHHLQRGPKLNYIAMILTWWL